MLALATVLQAYGNVGERDAVELTVMDKRWQMVLDCLGAEQPPFSRGTLFHFRMRLIAHNLDKTLLDGRSRWRSRLGDSVPGSCVRPWTPPRCLAPAVWRTR
jgi:hypothetical protein